MPESNTRSSSRTVYVGCKLPNGLVCEILEDPPADQMVATAGSLASRFHPKPPKASFTLRGANSVRNDFTLRSLSQPVYPFAVTAVPEALWDEWHARYKDADFIRAGLIFVVKRERDASAAAKEREPEKTGLEPLRPDVENEPRLNQKGLPIEKRVEADADRLASLNRLNSRDI